MTDKLCICGRSKTLPYCDNSHVAENWSCAIGERWTDYGFASSGRYQNLALKLSAHFGGEYVSSDTTDVVLGTLVTIIDGTDLNKFLTTETGLKARRFITITMGVEPALLAVAFPHHEIHSLGDLNVFQAFKRIRLLLEDPPSSSEEPSKSLVPCFLSHAIKDEPVILPAVEYLRNFYKADFFLCGDSIAPGEEWQRAISQALLERDVFALILSEYTLQSHFVSFEIGVATGLQKKIRVLSIDGSYPPRYLQHLQVIDLPRLQRQRSWLSIQDILVDELLKSLSFDLP